MSGFKFSDIADFFDSGRTAYPAAYEEYVLPRVAAPESGGGFWSTIGDYASEANEFLRKNEPLLKWGVPAIGGIASYLSARDYNKMAQEQRQALAAEKAARTSERRQMEAPRNFTLARQKVQGPTARRGEEAQYFLQNALKANPSTVQGYADGGAVQQQFAPEFYADGMLNFAGGGNVKKKLRQYIGDDMDLFGNQLRYGRRNEVYDDGALAELARRRAIEQLLLEKAQGNANPYLSGRMGEGDLGERLPPSPTTPAEQRLIDQLPKIFGMAEGGYFAGGTKGQDDKVPAMLSDGEFVIDAETVSMLGDGNNAAGASALEQLRQNVRKQKRSAPTNKIPSKAKKPEQYMKKGRK